ncbi:hypothetical protein BC332_33844 [Capsicum chinense]|nr:hypothetical protein BC332_33844 [Capsicum chinense]
MEPGSKAQWHHGTKAPWHHGIVAPRHRGTMVQRHHGSIALCHQDTVASWHRGTKVPGHCGTMEPRYQGSKAPWHLGTKAQWHRGTMAPRHQGTVAPRHHGTMAPRNQGTKAPWYHAGLAVALQRPHGQQRTTSTAGHWGWCWACVDGAFGRIARELCSVCAAGRAHATPASMRNATWLILPVVICLSQRLSRACLVRKGADEFKASAIVVCMEHHTRQIGVDKDPMPTASTAFENPDRRSWTMTVERSKEGVGHEGGLSIHPAHEM